MAEDERAERTGCPQYAAAGSWALDPLDHNDVDDETVELTKRELVRIALIATEVGARFQREGNTADPMAWMLVPRRLFAGRPAIEACADRDSCLRSVLVHGLGLDLDVKGELIDALLSSDIDEAAPLQPEPQDGKQHTQKMRDRTSKAIRRQPAMEGERL
ncbi:MAG: hypothetical protein WA908_02090 [Pontixanthobacter sp.]